ncbi:15423_t:CDS:2 [Dentiscutata heterogama]|uniref:15423_t:CDS:1 n=1 Tax=Dentiscutata heterogama TaxID=1316150 RepID=A0ACA9KQK1_9GLOM|nr:15423_t:CDS:2 [Dentiscutata heterogama]
MLNDYSFYASLHARTNNNNSKGCKNSMISNNMPQSSDKTQETEKLNINLTDLESNSAFFESFLETIKRDYKKCAKAKSVPALVSFLYDINRDIDPLARVKVEQKFVCKLNQ